MKITPVSVLACACLMLGAFLAGMFIGRNIAGGSIQTTVLNTPGTSQSAAPASSVPSQDKVNINTATLEELMTLEGIGQTYAQRIIDYREANGPFTDIKQIKNVSGIGDKRYEAIKDFITIGD